MTKQVSKEYLEKIYQDQSELSNDPEYLQALEKATSDFCEQRRHDSSINGGYPPSAWFRAGALWQKKYQENQVLKEEPLLNESGFKDGDILSSVSTPPLSRTYITIYKSERTEGKYGYAYHALMSFPNISPKDYKMFYNGTCLKEGFKLASEEEVILLIKTLKNEGYCFDDADKTLK